MSNSQLWSSDPLKGHPRNNNKTTIFQILTYFYSFWSIGCRGQAFFLLQMEAFAVPFASLVSASSPLTSQCQCPCWQWWWWWLLGRFSDLFLPGSCMFPFRQDATCKEYFCFHTSPSSWSYWSDQFLFPTHISTFIILLVWPVLGTIVP